MKREETGKWLFARTRPMHGRMACLIAGDILYSVLLTAFVLASRRMIDAGTAGNSCGVRGWGAVLAGLILLQLFFRILLNSIEETVRSKTGVVLRAHMAELLLEKEYAAVRKMHSGEWMNRMFSDVQIIADGAASILPNIAAIVTRLVCAAAALFYLQPVFAGVLFAGGGLLALTAGLLRRAFMELHRSVQEKQGRVQAFLQELTENLVIVKAFGREDAFKSGLEKRQEEHFSVQMKRRRLSIWANGGFSFVFQAGYFLALCVGAGGFLAGTMTYGTILALLQLVGQIQAPVSGLSGILPRIYGVFSSADRLRELEALPEERKSAPEAAGGGAFDPEGFRLLRCRDMAFSYGRTPVLKKADFTLERGDIAALTGLSGGGKTTLFLLLMGIYGGYKGEISIVTKRGTWTPCRETRRLFAYVPQGNGIFSGTIRDNVRFGGEDSDETVWEALETACAAQFVRALPQGLDTPLGERGSGLSEGQLQRIAIARAVRTQAPVILLDEATSALDGVTEAAVLANIQKLNRTCLIVTHREAALKICGRRLVLENGELKESSGLAGQNGVKEM